jgi:hypothetical protein
MKTIRLLGLALITILPLACGGSSGSNPDPVDSTTPGSSAAVTPSSDPATSTTTAAPGGAGAPGVAPAGAAGGANVPAAGPLVLQAMEANNYAFSSTLTIDVTQVKPSSDLTFDWSGVTRDFLGHDVSAADDIDMVALLMWRLSKPDLEVKLNNDDLQQSDLVAIAMVYADTVGGTTSSLLDMTSFGMPLEPDTLLGYVNIDDYDPAMHTYTLIATRGTTAGEGTLMIQGFQLSPDTENTQVTMTSDSTGLDYTVDMHSAQPTPMPVGTADAEIDWTNMTTTALGTEFIPSNITSLLVAKYTQPVSELEANFLDLELISDQMYRSDVTAGSSISLTKLTADDGTPFTGIDSEGTWIVALFCGSCANPAPWYLSVLQPQ